MNSQCLKYIKKCTKSQAENVKLKDKDIKILTVIAQTEKEKTIGQKEIAQKVGLDYSTINYKMRKFCESGIVVAQKFGRGNQRKYFVILEGLKKFNIQIEKFEKLPSRYNTPKDIKSISLKDLNQSLNILYQGANFSQKIIQKLNFLPKKNTPNGVYFKIDGRWWSFEYVKKLAGDDVQPFRYIRTKIKNKSPQTWRNPLSGTMFFNFDWQAVEKITDKSREFKMFRAIAAGTRFVFLTNNQIARLLEAYTPKFVFAKMAYIAAGIKKLDAGRRIRNLFAYLNRCLINMFNNWKSERAFEKVQDGIEYPRLMSVFEQIKAPAYSLAEFYRRIGSALGRWGAVHLFFDFYKYFDIPENLASESIQINFRAVYRVPCDNPELRYL